MSQYYLAEVVPAVRRFNLRLERDQFMLLMAAVNEIMLGAETYLAHAISGTIVPREWIPILFGPIAGVLLLIAGALAFKWRMAANVLATLTFLASIVVGVLGSYFHWVRAVLPNAPMGEQVSLSLLVWGPPMLAPIMFALIGILGMSAAWQESPAGSGTLILPGRIRLRMPFDKTRAYFLAVGAGTLFTVLSSVLDHARGGMENPWVWLPLAVGVFSAILAVTMGLTGWNRRDDLGWYLAAMTGMIVVALIGAGLHVLFNLSASGQFVSERFLRGAPAFAPLLFANMGAIGIIVLLEVKERLS